jgi:hypothetical protein
VSRSLEDLTAAAYRALLEGDEDECDRLCAEAEATLADEIDPEQTRH